MLKKVNLHCFHRVESVGRSGGLWMLSRSNKFTFEIILTGSHFIHLCIKGNGLPGMLCTTVYIHPQGSRKKNCFDNIRVVADNINGPWILLGDFNEITNEEEKKGGAPVDQSRCFRF